MSGSAHYTQTGKDPYPDCQRKAVLFFDIDNTLYPSSCGIADAMDVLIHQYFERLGLSDEKARELHRSYYRLYSLSMRGLVLHHDIDPLDYNRACDDALPLEHLLKPNPLIRTLLSSLDRRKVRLLALTNAYRTHALRVLKILDLTDLFEAVVSCDYAAPNFSCKPERGFFEEAMEHAGATSSTPIYFVDDSVLNVRGAQALGWNAVHYLENGSENGIDPKDVKAVHKLGDLKSLWPELFRGQ